MNLNERIRTCRVRSGLTQEQVADALNVSRQAVTKWENGRSAPSTENLFRLAELLGVTVDMILREESDTVVRNENADLPVFWKKRNFWIAVVSGTVFLLVINPYGMDMYIPVLFTLLCVMLNGFSTMIFSLLLYRCLERRVLGEDYGMYLGLLLISLAGHCIFSAMYWSCWVCAGISILCISLISLQKWKEKRKNNENST